MLDSDIVKDYIESTTSPTNSQTLSLDSSKTSSESEFSLDSPRSISETVDKISHQISSPNHNDEHNPQHEKIQKSSKSSSKKFKKAVNVLSAEDDEVLLKLVVKLKNSWKKILKRFNKVQNKSVSLTFLKLRYNQLSPRMAKRKGKFTHQEDILLAKYFIEYGSDWERIAGELKNRTPNMLKNRYYSFIRKRKILTDLLDEVKSANSGELEISTQSSENAEGNLTSISPTNSLSLLRSYEFERLSSEDNMIFFYGDSDKLESKVLDNDRLVLDWELNCFPEFSELQYKITTNWY